MSPDSLSSPPPADNRNGTARRICVIGAGPAGLCAAKECAAQLGNDAEIILYERRALLGGAWSQLNSDDAYSTKSTPIEWMTGVYEGLVTNLPKEITHYIEPGADSDYPPALQESFITAEQLLDYFKRYAQPIKHLIRYNTEVLEVTRQSEDVAGKGIWRVLVRNYTTNTVESTLFDVVFVCNGHHNEPQLPAFASNYTLPSLHSKYFVRAADYANQVVALVGAGPSGIDIAQHLSMAGAKKIYMLHRPASSLRIPYGGVLPPNIVDAPAVVDASAEALILADGTELTGLDAVIWCTGYTFSYPFFPPEHGVVSTPGGGAMVSPLYAHFAHAHHPDSLFFIGLCCNKMVYHWQCRAAIAMLSHREGAGVGLEEALGYERDRLESMRGSGTAMKHYHSVSGQWEYAEMLARRHCGFDVDSGGSGERVYRPVMRKIFEHVLAQVRIDVWGYKADRYRVLDDENFLVEKGCGENKE